MSKKIVICGATGLVGRYLTEKLHEEGHDVVVVGRNPQALRERFSFDLLALSWDEFVSVNPDDIDVIVNLAGASVGEKRWSAAYKRVMQDSRLKTTQMCVGIVARNPKIHLVNASAVSAYGFYVDDPLQFAEGDERKRTGTSFLQDLIDDWETEALKAEVDGARVTLLRMGVVLDRAGGSLPILARPYQFNFGGPIGAGTQVMSWVGIRDLVNAVIFLIERGDLTGPVNLVSPGACTQKEFAVALGKALGKPSRLPLPAPIAGAMMGQFGQELVLRGQRVTPKVLLENGFEFQDTEINAFLERLFAR